MCKSEIVEVIIRRNCESYEKEWYIRDITIPVKFQTLDNKKTHKKILVMILKYY